MGQYVNIAETVAEEASLGGTEELQEFSEQTLSTYIARFQQHATNLGLCKVYFGSAMQQSTFDNESTSIMNQMKKVAQQASDINTYPSSKGGADILPNNEIEDTIKDAASKVEQNSQKNLQSGRNNIEYNRALEQFQRVILEISRDVYKLREGVTGVTEHFAFTYRGQNGAMAATTVPVDQFFSEILNNNSFSEILRLEQRGSGIKDWSFRFNNRATKSVLAQLVNKGKGINYVIENILNADGISQNAMDLYRTAKKSTTSKYVRYKDLGKREKKKVDEKFSDDIYRMDYGYLVVRKDFQTGFIAQSIFNAFINETVYNYETDRIAWYKGADVMSKDGKTGYSVKNLLDQAPTLFAVNSVERAIYEINTTLNRVKNLGFDKIKSVLKQAVFSPAEEMDLAANTDIETILDILHV